MSNLDLLSGRRLAAIVAADVVGYSTLVSANEDLALNRIETLIERIIRPTVTLYRGRIFKILGDGFLIEFKSVVDSTRCAIAIQHAVSLGKFENESVGLQLRIGIHIGDVISKGDDLLGDGVNIAARVEGVAIPGTICLSEDAQRQIAGKVDIELVDRGEIELKGISRRVRIYQSHVFKLFKREDGVYLPYEQPAPAENEKTTLAVLPFANMSGPDQEYFVDGITEEIITALSRLKWFVVISRNSSFIYKGRSTDARQVSRELGVRYILEGSVRKSGDRLRITGQLIEASTGNHIWADKFDGTLEDVFEFQDRVSESILGALEPNLRVAEIRRSSLKPTENLDAYDCFLRAYWHFYQFTREGSDAALKFLEQAIAIDSNFALAYAFSASIYVRRTYQGWSTDRAADEQLGARFAQQALDRGGDEAGVLRRVGHALAHSGHDIHASAALAERAFQMEPNSAEGVAQTGWMQMYVGNYDISISRFERAKRLSPLDPMFATYNAGLAGSYMFLEEFDMAIRFARECLAANPRYNTAYRSLAASLALAGRIDEAKAEYLNLLELDEFASIENLPKAIKQTPKFNIYAMGLRLAGMPD